MSGVAGRVDVVDVVELRGLSARGHHGVLRAETALGQVFRADVALHLGGPGAAGTATAAATDDLADAVDYSAVAASVVAVLAGEPVRLVEALAQRVAEACLAHPGVAAVDVAVHKPQAPVAVPLDDVVVRVHRRRGQLLDAVPARAVPVVLALGANLGDSAAALASAVRALAAVPGLDEVTASPVLRSAPVVGDVGPAGQPDYLNAVVRATTSLSPREVLAAARAVEAAHGRDTAARAREQRWGPRVLDVDVVAYARLVAADDELVLPHPRAAERAFVLVPWAQLAPDDHLPGAGRVGDLAAALDPGPAPASATTPTAPTAPTAPGGAP